MCQRRRWCFGLVRHRHRHCHRRRRRRHCYCRRHCHSHCNCQCRNGKNKKCTKNARRCTHICITAQHTRNNTHTHNTEKTNTRCPTHVLTPFLASFSSGILLLQSVLQGLKDHFIFIFISYRVGRALTHGLQTLHASHQEFIVLGHPGEERDLGNLAEGTDQPAGR